MRIYYDSETDTFIRVKQRGKKEAFDAVYLDAEVNNSLHDFFTNLANILRDEEPSIVLGEYEATIRRKRITGECLGAVVPYTTCLIFRDSPHKFVDIYV